MDITKVLLAAELLVIVVFVDFSLARTLVQPFSQGSNQFIQGADPLHQPYAPAQYKYSYDAVDANSGNQFGHGEERNDQVTQGEYRVLMPNGRTKVVRYTVDGDSGFKADVTYE